MTGLQPLASVGGTGQGATGPEQLPEQSFSGWEPKKLFTRSTTGAERFEDVAWGWGFDSRADGRSLVAADLDGDGDLDLVISNRAAPRVQVFENTGEGGGALELELVATTTQREADGATVEVDGLGAFPVVLARGFVSSVSPRVHVGLGARKTAHLRVRWRGGRLEDFGELAPGGVLRLVEGTGRAGLLHRFEPRRAVALLHWPSRVADIAPEATGPRLVQLFMRSCKPCREEVPELNAIARAGVPVLGLGLHSAAELPAIRAELKMEYSVAELPPAVAEAFEGAGGLTLPTVLVYGNDGRLARVVRGRAQLPTVLSELGVRASPGP